VQDTLIACVDDLKGLPNAINTVYPKTQVQPCIVHIVRHSMRFVLWTDKKAVAADLKAIYGDDKLEMAKANIEHFDEV
jgi:transposase-like protein